MSNKTNSSITQNDDMVQTLAGIKAAAEWGVFSDNTAINAQIAASASLYLWAIENSDTAEGDRVEAQKFIDDLHTRYAGKKAGAK